VWPYKVEGHKFYAVPISTYRLSGEMVPLQDKYFDESGLGSTQWYDALRGKFEEAQNNDIPMVIVLTSSISGSGDYFDALKRFLDFALSKDTSFVTTMELVNMVRPEGYQPADAATEECKTCGQKNNVTIALTMDNLTQASPGAETA
jgi:hypothetical protein